MNDIGNTHTASIIETLTRFWGETLQIEEDAHGFHLAYPLMLPDGLQVVFRLRPITPTHAILSDAGEVLRFLSGQGVNPDSSANLHLIEDRLAFFEMQRDGFELFREIRLPLQAVDVHLFAEGLVALSHLLYRADSTPQQENIARQSMDRFFHTQGIKPIRNAKLEGNLEKAIRVSYYIEQGQGLALEVVDRRNNLHGYMQQWGWRWRDLHDKRPHLLRAMVYDPDRQNWDETSLNIGKSECDLFFPYHSTNELQDAIQSLL